MCDCKNCAKEAKHKRKHSKHKAKEESLYEAIFKISPKNGDIVCVVSPEGPLKPAVMTNIQGMLNRMGLDKCIILCLPDSVTLQTFDGSHEDLFAAMAGQASHC